MRCWKSAKTSVSEAVPLPGICIGLLWALVMSTPATAQQVAPGLHSDLGRSHVFELPSAIPGTSEYQLEKRSRQLSAMLTDLAPVASARVMLTAAAAEPNAVSAVLQLELVPDMAASSELCRTIVSLLKHVEPRIRAETILITDRQGRILYDRGQPTMPAAPDAAQVGDAAGQRRGAHLPLIGVGLLVGLVIAVAWWWVGAGRVSLRTARDAPDGPWAFLCAASPSRLTALLSEQRPEVVGAIMAESDERTRGRLRWAMRRTGHPQMAAPQRPMHPEISHAVVEGIRQMLAVDIDP